MKIIEASSKGDFAVCRQRIEDYISVIQAEIQKVHNVLDIIRQLNNSGEKNNPNKKILYTKSEAARQIGTTKDSIRNWERNGLLNRHFTAYQKRLYTKSDINRMKIIYMLLRAGYSIAAIFNYFNELDQHNKDAMQILIDPKKDENIIGCKDRYLQALSEENNRWTEIFKILKK
jgi:DNA-binding transcriptional MerR regulator